MSAPKILVVVYDVTALTAAQITELSNAANAAAYVEGAANVTAYSTLVGEDGIEIDADGSLRPRSEGGWSVQQVKSFARRFAVANKPAWHAYVPEVREALVDRYVLSIVTAQERRSVTVKAIDSLRSRLVAALHLYNKMVVDPRDADDAGEVTP